MPSFDTIDLERAFAAGRSRSDTLASLAIHGSAVLLFGALATRAFADTNVVAWSAGFAYLVYDTALIAAVFRQTLPLLRARAPAHSAGARPTIAVILTAHDEATVLPITLSALLKQDDPPDLVLIADDGSRDATPDALMRFGLTPPPLGSVAASTTHPRVRWLRLPHGGKARALNAALPAIDTELVVTVDA